MNFQEEEDVHERKDQTDQDVTNTDNLYITIKDKKKMDRDHELQYASDMSTDSASSVIRVEVSRFGSIIGRGLGMCYYLRNNQHVNVDYFNSNMSEIKGIEGKKSEPFH